MIVAGAFVALTLDDGVSGSERGGVGDGGAGEGDGVHEGLSGAVSARRFDLGIDEYLVSWLWLGCEGGRECEYECESEAEEERRRVGMGHHGWTFIQLPKCLDLNFHEHLHFDLC